MNSSENQSSSNQPGPPSPDKTSLTRWIMLGLAAWALYLAYGAAFSPTMPLEYRIRRGGVVLVCCALFLGWFWILQRVHARRRRTP